MKEAYERVEKTGMVYGESSRKYNLNEESGEDGNIWDFIVPMAVLVIVAVATGNLVVAQVVTLLATLVFYLVKKVLTFSEYWDCFLNGFSDMLPIVTLIISALTFQQIASEMKMTEFFIAITRPVLSAHLFPMIAFIIRVGFLAFYESQMPWGVCSLVAPVLLSMGTFCRSKPGSDHGGYPFRLRIRKPCLLLF